MERGTKENITLQESCLLCENQTLGTFKESVSEDVQQLISCALRGGTAGVYLNDELSIYFISDPLLKELKKTRDQFMEQFHGSFLETIHPDDRKKYIQELKMSFQKGIIFEQMCRVKVNDQYCYMRDIGKKVELEDDSEIVLLMRSNVSAILDYQRDAKEQQSDSEDKKQELKDVANNIPCGVCKISLDQHFTLLYGNEGFYKILGYTQEQLKEEKNNCLIELIYEKDLSQVKAVIQKTVKMKQTEIEFEHRMIDRTGKVTWLLVKGNFSYQNETPDLICSVLDITSRKKIEEEAKISEERFRIALSQTDNTIFEYDIKTHVMIHGDRSADYYGLKQRTENVPDSLISAGVVHSDSAKVFLEMYHNIHLGRKSASCLVKARLKNGNFAWRKILMTTIFDENGIPVSAVGVLEDVDEQVRREKELRQQTERDTLTGLYNRGYMASRIRKESEHRREGIVQAMIIIDIDDFKGVNDQYGHLFGDYVLSESGRRISSLFGRDGVIGRIGGDEFIAFINNLPSEADAVTYAERIVASFGTKFSDRGIVTKVSCSVGVAVCPRDGESFEILYQNADIALYEAKKTGKNKVSQYHFPW